MTLFRFIAASSSGFILMALFLSASQGRNQKHPIKSDTYHEYDIKYDSTGIPKKNESAKYHQETYDQAGRKILYLEYSSSSESSAYSRLVSSTRYYYNKRGLLTQKSVYRYSGIDSTLTLLTISRYDYNNKGSVLHFSTYRYQSGDSTLEHDEMYTYDSLRLKYKIVVNNHFGHKGIKTSDGKRDSAVYVVINSDTVHIDGKMIYPQDNRRHKSTSWDGELDNIVIQSFKMADGKHDSIVLMTFSIGDTLHDPSKARILTIPTPLRYNYNRRIYDTEGRVREHWLNLYRFGLWAIQRFDKKGRNVETDVYDNDSMLVSKNFPKYNRHGDNIATIIYHGDTVTRELNHKYRYDKLGNILIDSIYNDGKLYQIKTHQYEYY